MQQTWKDVRLWTLPVDSVFTTRNSLDFAYVDLKIFWQGKCSHVSSFNGNFYTDAFPLPQAPHRAMDFHHFSGFWHSCSGWENCLSKPFWNGAYSSICKMLLNIKCLSSTGMTILAQSCFWSPPSFELLKVNMHVQFVGLSILCLAKALIKRMKQRQANKQNKQNETKQDRIE